MTFTRLWVLHLLWLVPVLIFVQIVHIRKKNRVMAMFADHDLLLRLTEENKKGLLFLKGFLLVCSLTCMIFALSGPRWGSHYEEAIQKGVDIMIELDVSRSMLSEDIRPSRLERAKREIIDFLRVVEGDRVGLVVFAGRAFVQCPLTLDYAALEMFVNAITPDLVPVQGTDLGAAIDTGISAFDPKTATDKVMILLTDGEDNEGKGVYAAKRAAAKGIKIFVYGIGDITGSPIPDGHGGFKKDKNGNIIMSKLNEDGLKRIASITGGVYVRSVTGDLDLDMLYFNGIKKRTEAKRLKSGKIRVYEERFYLFLLPAILFLLLEEIIDPRGRKRGKSYRAGSIPVLSAIILLFLFLAIPSNAAPNPDKLYREGRYAEAEKLYAKEDMDHPKDIRYRYNRGCAAYRNNNFKGAKAAFESVAIRAKDKNILAKALYNLGNTAFRQGDMASAANYYKRAIILDPNNMNARYNLELTLNRLKKNKNEQKNKGKTGNKKGKGKSSPKKHSNGNRENRQKDKNMQGPKQKNNSGEKGKNEQRQANANSRPQPKGPSGNLAGPETKKQQSSDNRHSIHNAMTKKKAEALIDNVEDNPADFMKFNFPKGKRESPSGKDW